MKKTLLSALVLLAALVAQAQTKIAPKLEKGMKMTYVETFTADAGGAAIKGNSESQYVVTDVTPTGAVIEATNSNITIDGDKSNPMVGILSIAQKMMEGLPVRMATDADGRVVKLLNFADLKDKSMKTVNAMLDKLYAETPNLAQMMPREALTEQIGSKLTEEEILANYQNGNDVLSLNGKTLQNGATEKYEKEGMKMKRMYFVNGKNVTTNGSMNMSKDELKAMIIEKVEKLVPDQAELIKQNIDQVMATGMIKFESKETATYELQDDGWVKSIKSESTNEAMGQQMKTTTTVTIK